MFTCSTGFPLNIILKFVNFLIYKIEVYAYQKFSYLLISHYSNMKRK